MRPGSSQDQRSSRDMPRERRIYEARGDPTENRSRRDYQSESTRDDRPGDTRDRSWNDASLGKERERDRERERPRERDRDRDGRDKGRDRQDRGDKEYEGDRNRDRGSEKGREKGGKEHDRGHDRDSGRHRDRDRHRQRHRHERSLSRSRSRSPVRGSSRRNRDQSPTYDGREGSYGRSPPPPPRDVEMNDAEEGEEEDEEAKMARLMGFSSLTTTKGKRVAGNSEAGTVDVVKVRTWRQYMNRRGGFNRPLDKV